MEPKTTWVDNKYWVPGRYADAGQRQQVRSRTILPKVEVVELMTDSESENTDKEVIDQNDPAIEDNDYKREEVTITSKLSEHQGVDSLQSLEEELASLSIHQHHRLFQNVKKRDTRSVIQKRKPRTAFRSIVKNDSIDILHKQLQSLHLVGLVALKEFTVTSCVKWSDDSDTSATECSLHSGTNIPRNDYY